MSAPLPDLHRARIHRRLAQLSDRGWLTKSLVGINVALYLAAGAVAWLRHETDGIGVLIAERSPRLLLALGSLSTRAVEHGQWWRLFTAWWLHADGSHILFNMVALWGLGRLAETLFGAPRMAALYATCGLAAAIASAAMGTPGSVGASGAIFGLMGAVATFGWRRGVRVPNLVPWILFNLVMGAAVPAIDQAAHVGGLLTGAALGLVLGSPVQPGWNGTRARRTALAIGGGVTMAFGAIWVAVECILTAIRARG